MNGPRARPIAPLYLKLIAEIRAWRESYNISLAMLDDIAGLSDRYSTHVLAPESPSGKVAGWHTLSWLVQALLGEAYALWLTPPPDDKRVGREPRLALARRFLAALFGPTWQADLDSLHATAGGAIQ